MASTSAGVRADGSVDPAAHRAIFAELEEMQAVVRAAGTAAGGRVSDLPSRELREEIRRLRHDAELLRLKAAMESRELLASQLSALRKAMEKEVRWTSDRIVRHTEAHGESKSAIGSKRELLDALHGEMKAFQACMDRALTAAHRALRGRLLPSKPTALLGADRLASDQVRWLQSCCGVLFPKCLVCIFDPTRVDTSPWTVLEAEAAKAAAIVQPSELSAALTSRGR